jgi:hypothetical protein
MVMDLKVGRAIEPYVPEGEAVLGAFVAVRGPRPGTEILILPLAFVLSASLPSGLVSIVMSGALGGGDEDEARRLSKLPKPS